MGLQTRHRLRSTSAGSAGADSSSQSGNGAEESTDEETTQLDGTAPLIVIRQTARRVTEELIERPLDGVIEINRNGDDGWIAVVEVVERRAIPDTQDILGCYEFEFDGDGTVIRYERIDRYRRADTDHADSIE